MRPMKGVKVTDDQLKLLEFPLYASLKLDGIRCEVEEGKALSASLKPISNRFIYNFLSQPEFEGMDGEILLKHTREFNEVQSAVMAQDGEPDFEYHVFDYCDQCTTSFEGRLALLMLDDTFDKYPERVKRVKHVLCNNLEEFLAFETLALEQGYEGVMTRHPRKPYKFGKATIKQQNCLKRKPMEEAECIIYGFEEGEENTNELQRNEMGLAKRSSAKAGKVPNGTLGKFLVWSKEFGQFKIGTGEGLDFPLRDQVWENQAYFYGKIIQYRFQRMGTVDKPRIPIYMHIRHPDTMDATLVEELWDGLLAIQGENQTPGL